MGEFLGTTLLNAIINIMDIKTKQNNVINIPESITISLSLVSGDNMHNPFNPNEILLSLLATTAKPTLINIVSTMFVTLIIFDVDSNEL